MTDDADGADEPEADGDEESEPLPTMDAHPDDANTLPTAVIEEAEPGEEVAEGSGALALAGTVLAWVIGVALIGVGILGLSGDGAGIVPFALGLFVTPRTRRELQELCGLLCG